MTETKTMPVKSQEASLSQCMKRIIPTRIMIMIAQNSSKNIVRLYFNSLRIQSKIALVYLNLEI